MDGPLLPPSNGCACCSPGEEPVATGARRERLREGTLRNIRRLADQLNEPIGRLIPLTAAGTAEEREVLLRHQNTVCLDLLDHAMRIPTTTAFADYDLLAGINMNPGNPLDALWGLAEEAAQ